MAKRSKFSDRALSERLGASGTCPIPSTHDKLNEAHFFLHQMIDHYHEPDPFRYNLSAFLHAAKSVVHMLKMELQGRKGAAEWFRSDEIGPLNSVEVQALFKLRDSVVHLQSLVPSSSATIAMFRGDRLKMGFSGMSMNPMQSSLPVLVGIRNNNLFVPPHREFIGEEMCIERFWRTSQLGDSEVGETCVSAFSHLASVVSAAHRLVGDTFEPNPDCGIDLQEQRILRESTVFPELLKAWDTGYPTEKIGPKHNPLPLLKFPSRDSERLHELSPGDSAEGWLGWPSPHWPPEFVSFLLYSINGEVIRKNTCVFVESREISISTVEPPSDEI